VQAIAKHLRDAETKLRSEVWPASWVVGLLWVIRIVLSSSRRMITSRMTYGGCSTNAPWGSLSICSISDAGSGPY